MRFTVKPPTRLARKANKRPPESKSILSQRAAVDWRDARQSRHALKNLREWALLLFALFIALDLGGVQYGLHLAATAPRAPDIATGHVAALVRGHRAARYFIYVTPHERFVLLTILAAAAIALLALLALIVVHGVELLRAERHDSSEHR